MLDSADAFPAGKRRPPLPGGDYAVSLEAKPKAARRALEIYLVALLGGMAIAAMLLFAAGVDTGTINTNAAATLAIEPSATAMLPEPSSAPSGPDPDGAIGPRPSRASAAEGLAVAPGGLPQTASVEASANAPGTAMIGAVASDVIAALPTPAEAMPALLNLAAKDQAAKAIGSDLANLEAVSTTASAPRVSQSFASARRQPKDVSRNLQSAAHHPPRRSPPRLWPRRADPSVGMAAPLTRGLARSGCRAGSDPRWGEPDATGTPILICNPYYRSLSVDVF